MLGNKKITGNEQPAINCITMLIQPYSSDWPRAFEKIRDAIMAGLQGFDYRIEHVGSTAVLQMAAKPIIDLDIIYYQPDAFEKISWGLTQIGYYHNGNQGIDNREVFKRNGKSTYPILDTLLHHLYVCPAGSKALERHILLRDYLRKNEWARIAYQQLKYELAEKANQDRKQYAALKELYSNQLIDLMIEKEKNELTASDGSSDR